MVYRNVEQLELHLAALENGVGKDSGCKSVDIAVRDLIRIGISAREAKQDRARQQSEHRKAVEKAQDLVEPKRKSIQPFITASMASSTVRAFCCDTALLIHQFSRDGLTSLLLDPAGKHGDGGDGGAGAGEGEGEEEVHNDDDEPHLVDKDAGDEYDPSAPAMHVPAREEYDERECFGTSSEEEGQ
jgi:hypothetical protein